MMFVPSVFDRDYDLFDDVFDDAFRPFRNTDSLMRTDVEEKDGKYVMTCELPGFNKDDVKMSLKDGVLNIEASHKENNDEKDKKGNVIRQERYEGTMSRSFYVGKDVKESDIRASFKNGVLSVEIPEAKEVEEKPEEKYISIE